MRMQYMIIFCLILGFGVAIISCDDKKLGSGSSGDRKYDSLFLGISLRMDKKAFYDHCWELNSKEVFTHAPSNQQVEYMLVGQFEKPVLMRFYPSFYKDKIFEMPVTFSYEAWAPWNKQYSAHVLFLQMVQVFKKWYGEDFKIIEHPRMGTIYVKIDGKRRINLFIRDDQFVQAVFTDLELAKEKEGEEQKGFDEKSSQ